MSQELSTSVVAVTVFPDHARVTRRGEVQLQAGRSQVVLADLPLGLVEDSVRAGGAGPVAVRGVEVGVQRRSEDPDGERRGALIEERRAVRDRQAEVADRRRTLELRVQLVERVVQGAGRPLAGALAEQATSQRLESLSATVDEQLGALLAQLRELGAEERELKRRHETLTRAIGDLGAPGSDRRAVTIDLEAGEPCRARLDVEYLVPDAGWSSRYDARLDGKTLQVDWFALITQQTGEDWPDCELELSTARPSFTLEIPELDPWYVGVYEPRPLTRQRLMSYGAAPMAAAPAPGGAAEPVDALAAEEPVTYTGAVAEHGETATSYRLAGHGGIPTDGSAHQVLIDRMEFPAVLGHVVAPVRDLDVYLRATVTNDGQHTLRPGPASLFHGGQFVGSTVLEIWAPGEERELALGLDDRIRVERKLVSRKAGKSLVGGTARHEAGYRIEVSNHSPSEARIEVWDQVPVTNSPKVEVKDVQIRPAPAGTDDVGRVRWDLELAPGAGSTLTLSYRVDVAKGAALSGWRD